MVFCLHSVWLCLVDRVCYFPFFEIFWLGVCYLSLQFLLWEFFDWRLFCPGLCDISVEYLSFIMDFLATFLSLCFDFLSIFCPFFWSYLVPFYGSNYIPLYLFFYVLLYSHYIGSYYLCFTPFFLGFCVLNLSILNNLVTRIHLKVQTCLNFLDVLGLIASPV